MQRKLDDYRARWKSRNGVAGPPSSASAADEELALQLDWDTPLPDESPAVQGG
jgi:hypothetical protein